MLSGYVPYVLLNLAAFEFKNSMSCSICSSARMVFFTDSVLGTIMNFSLAGEGGIALIMPALTMSSGDEGNFPPFRFTYSLSASAQLILYRHRVYIFYIPQCKFPSSFARARFIYCFPDLSGELSLNSLGMSRCGYIVQGSPPQGSKPRFCGGFPE